jgi:glycosyltransferase involved in cell wall biosynthesis
MPQRGVEVGMRIGLYGSIANAGYTLTRGLRAAGYDAEYIHEPADRYPMSQPLWEEVALTIDPARLPDDVPTPAEWKELERAHGWVQPPWVVQADDGGARLTARQRLRAARLLASAPRSRRELREHLVAFAPRIAAFARYDWLVVSGVRLVDAFLSTSPYVFWPHGGDLTLVPSRSETSHQRFEAAAMRAAIRGAAICGTHDPMLAEHFNHLGVHDVPFLPFLVDTDRYAPRPLEARGTYARELSKRAGGRRTLFLAARQDVYWKGTDRFARAFARAVRDGAELLLVVSPWGNDAAQVGTLLGEQLPAEALYVLPGVVSKPVLIDLYSAADVVVDQFALGVHGSTMLEALACGAPVMISLDVDRFRRRWPAWVPPPVLNVSSEEEIYATLRSLGAGELDVEALGGQGRAWVDEYHGIRNAHRFLPPR